MKLFRAVTTIVVFFLAISCFAGTDGVEILGDEKKKLHDKMKAVPAMKRAVVALIYNKLATERVYGDWSPQSSHGLKPGVITMSNLHERCLPTKTIKYWDGIPKHCWNMKGVPVKQTYVINYVCHIPSPNNRYEAKWNFDVDICSPGYGRIKTPGTANGQLTGVAIEDFELQSVVDVKKQLKELREADVIADQ